MEGAPSIRGAVAHLTCPVLLIKCASCYRIETISNVIGIYIELDSTIANI